MLLGEMKHIYCFVVVVVCWLIGLKIKNLGFGHHGMIDANEKCHLCVCACVSAARVLINYKCFNLLSNEESLFSVQAKAHFPWCNKMHCKKNKNKKINR